jgi:hypothetical protein
VQLYVIHVSANRLTDATLHGEIGLRSGVDIHALILNWAQLGRPEEGGRTCTSKYSGKQRFDLGLLDNLEFSQADIHEQQCA